MVDVIRSYDPPKDRKFSLSMFVWGMFLFILIGLSICMAAYFYSSQGWLSVAVFGGMAVSPLLFLIFGRSPNTVERNSVSSDYSEEIYDLSLIHI